MSLADTGMTAISHIGDTLKMNAAKLAAASYGDATSKSLSQYSTELQLRPTFALESELLNLDDMGKLIQTGLANYAGFYIIALSIDNTINGVRIGRAVGKYNPSRDATGEAINILGQTAIHVSTASYKPAVVSGKPTLSTLGFKTGLPAKVPDLPKKYLEHQAKQLARENSAYTILNPNAEIEDQIVDAQLGSGVNQSSTNMTDEINKLANLAVGRILTVEVARDEAKATINMLLKPEMKSIRSNLLVEIAGITKKPMSMRERWTAFWDRETINSSWDYLTCRDLAEAHRRNLVEDQTGYYEKTHKRNVNNKIATLLTGTFSVGTVANTWIISEATALRIQATIGAKFNNKRARDKFMAESGCMTLIVYNQDYQRIMIYNHGLDDISEISMGYLEKKQKSENFDFDIFKMLSQGSAPII